MLSEDREPIMLYLLRDLAPTFTSTLVFTYPHPHLRPRVYQMCSVSWRTHSVLVMEDPVTLQLHPVLLPVPQALVWGTLWITRVFAMH